MCDECGPWDLDVGVEDTPEARTTPADAIFTHCPCVRAPSGCRVGRRVAHPVGVGARSTACSRDQTPVVRDLGGGDRCGRCWRTIVSPRSGSGPPDADEDLSAALGSAPHPYRPCQRSSAPSTASDAAVLDSVLGPGCGLAPGVVRQRRVIVFDGKTVRGARNRAAPWPRTWSRRSTTAPAPCSGQLAITAKSNEIPAVRTLLASFDLAGAVVTVDAMHTQTDTATLIVQAGGDYVVHRQGQPAYPVRSVQPAAVARRARAHASPLRPRTPRHRAPSRSSPPRPGSTFAGAAQVAQLRRTVTRAGRRPSRSST